jgi:peroxiredoxin
MITRWPLFILSVVALATTALFAEPAPASPAPSAPARPAAVGSAEPGDNVQPLTGPQADLQQLVEDISAKLRAGQITPESLAPELKRFDALLAKYADQKTDDVASILVSKAMLHLQVFRDYAAGADLLRKVQADFPTTEVAAHCGEILEKLEPMLASAKISAALHPSAEFPPFKETGLDGQPLSLADYRGKVVLVDFWATWCGPCVRELPNVLAAYEKFHGKGFEIVGISLDKDRTKLDAFIQDNKMTWRQYFDGLGWGNKLAKAYGVNSIPATYLLDREGKIIAKDLRGEELEQELAKLLP